MDIKMREKIIKLIEGCRGDDLYRAKLAFAGCTRSDMQKEYGESGMTRAQIVQQYERHEAEIDKMKEWVAKAGEPS